MLSAARLLKFGPSRSLAFLLAVAAPGQVAVAQIVEHHWQGDDTDDHLGSDVASLGDVNGDGVDDLALGMSGYFVNGFTRGAVRVVSGSDGTEIWTQLGQTPNGYLGTCVAAAGDVDGDGAVDVVAGAPAGFPSQAIVFSGSTGSVLHLFNGSIPFDDTWFGSCVAGVGDVDGDGFDDVLVGSPYEDFGSVNDAGAARVFSGATGAILYHLGGTDASGKFGTSVSGAGDLDGDGRPDFMVGAYEEDATGPLSGAVHIYSGRNGSLLRLLVGNGYSQHWGVDIADAGDVDVDGVPDQVIVADAEDGWVHSVAKVVSGATGQTLFTFKGPIGQQNPKYVSADGAGDVDGDGSPDLVLGMVMPTSGLASRVELRSGTDGALLHSFAPFDPSNNFGIRVAPAGDVDDDGRSEVIIGSPYSSVNGFFCGSAYVAGLGCSFAQIYCTAKPSSIAGCTPKMTFSGLPSISAGAGFWIRALDVPGGHNLGVMFYGTSGTAKAPFNGGTLCVGSPLTRVPAIDAGGTAGVCDGVLAVDFNAWIASHPTFEAGGIVNAQFWFRDPPEPISGTGLSNAIRFAPCP